MSSPQNISKENVENEMEAEAVLYDVLNKIFENLSIRMLQEAAKVCKSWQKAANLEIAKRSSIDCLVLPLTFGENDYESDENDDIIASLKIIPHLGLLFINDEAPRWANRDEADACYFYYKDCLDTADHYVPIGVISGLAVSMNNIEVKGQNNKAAGLLVPSTSGLKIDTYRPDHSDILSHHDSNTLPLLAQTALNNLLTTEEENNCFIMLNYLGLDDDDINISRSFLPAFLNSLKQRCKPGTYSLWGGEVCDIVSDIYGNDKSLPVWSIIIRLSGAAINSWSIVIKLNLSTAEAENKLLDLKKSIKYKKNTYALAIVPSNKTESFEQRISKTEVFRKVFPNVPLLGTYQHQEFFQIGVNSVNFDNDPDLQHEKSIAYLIITS